MQLNSLVSGSTGKIPFEIIYGIAPSLAIQSAIYLPDAQDFVETRETIRKEAVDTLELAKARMALHYDKTHQPPQLHGKVYLKLAKSGRPRYYVKGNSKLSAAKVGLFPIKRRISNLAYELELPAKMRIHPMISVAWLEQHTDDDEHGRVISAPPPVMVDGQDEYVVEKLLRQSADGSKIKVKWKQYDETT